MEMNDNLRSERMRRVREAFDALSMEDKTAFLAEATASTVARGLEFAGKAVADELDNLFRTFGEVKKEKEAKEAEEERRDDNPFTGQP